MPLQHINVSPVTDCDKEIEAAFSDPQMYIRGKKSEDGLGRSESQSSSQTSTLEICRICHCEGDTEGGLIAPCYCSGSLRYVHQTCLQQWIKSSNIKCCELCKFQFIMHTRTKPFMEWEPLEMTGFERRKLLCAVVFHAIALTCVVWSLYVLISRTAEEIHEGILEWPFWTKLIVVAIGFTGGVVFMYIQCKAYVQICQRWKAFNRVIYVQNAPEKQPLPPQVPLEGPTGSGGGGGNLLTKPPRHQQANENSGGGGGYKDETSIDLKGVRNLHIFFNDESRLCLQNEERESEETEGGPPDTSWRIKIGKAESTPSQRNAESEPKAGPESCDVEDCLPSGSKSTDSTKANNDSVVKLQIKKAEIVIKFGGEGNGGEEVPSTDRQDTSVNIKIDDKERGEPIVIDVVKKKPPPPPLLPLPLGAGGAIGGAGAGAEAKDPVQIRFDFSGEEEAARGGAADDSCSDSKLLQVTTHRSQWAVTTDPESESDSSSHSPLLSAKNSSFIKTV